MLNLLLTGQHILQACSWSAATATTPFTLSCFKTVYWGFLQIKRVFRTLRTKAHPDKGGDAETFNALVKAHTVLSDPEKVGRHVMNLPLFIMGEDGARTLRRIAVCLSLLVPGAR
jgi:hypothetical protein